MIQILQQFFKMPNFYKESTHLRHGKFWISRNLYTFLFRVSLGKYWNSNWINKVKLCSYQRYLYQFFQSQDWGQHGPKYTLGEKMTQKHRWFKLRMAPLKIMSPHCEYAQITRASQGQNWNDAHKLGSFLEIWR